ncbi:MAG TPA: hypothetical protein VKR61_13735 [Bryobacteraceae bacterium]|nr:hypothetical protein [Bryobacteraceae bacterium]
MVRGRGVAGWIVCLGLLILPCAAHATSCAGLPTSFTGNEFPNGDFFSNFDNPCYTVSLGTGYGSAKWGDLNAVYFQLYYKVDPRYQLILVGTFPNTRYFSVTLYDTHSALSQSILDTSIMPLTSQYINPYQPGIAYVAGQQYAIPISFGGTPGTRETGCMMNGYNVNGNGLDATVRHPGMDWNSDTGFFAQHASFPDHAVDTPQHTNPNTAGVVMVRAYLDDTPLGYDTNPHIIVRDVASGCAYPAAYVSSTLQIVAQTSAVGGLWLDQQQFAGHKTYETSYLPKLCDAPVASPDRLRWTRQPEYIPATNPDASYIVAPLPTGLPATLAAAGEVMRVRVRIPAVPPTPCASGCVRSGNEQMRYMSLSFVDPAGNTIASVADRAFTTDASGYATLIVGTGAAIPSWINPANGYTFLNLTALQNYQQTTLLDLRHIIPAAGFTCAGQFVPYRTSIDSPAGSLMGDYVPVVDYPAAAKLPQKAAPLMGPSACGTYPAGLSGIRPNCAVLPEPPIAIASVVTQCPAPGCNQFVAQAAPPVTIVGDGFGVFPEGLPFTGDTNYLRISDHTQGWSAGYNGNRCTVSISSWADNLIQLVANVDQNGRCKLVAGDIVHVEVWNPQTMVQAKLKVTVTGN